MKSRRLPSIYGVRRRFVHRRAALKAVPGPFQKISMLFSTPRGGRFSRAPPFVKELEFHVHRGYSSLIVYKRGLPVRMNFGSKYCTKANSSLRAVSARRANHPDQCLHSHHSQLLADTRHRLDYDPGMG